MKNSVLLSLFVIVLFSVGCSSFRKVNKVVYDKKANQKILIGKVTREGFEKKPFKEWFDNEYNSYKPDERAIKALKRLMPANAEITIIMGTWCPDSRREVPRFLKILDQIGFNYDHLTIYCVNRDFQAGNVDISSYNVKRIPTFIYKHYGYVAGRIVEKPKISLEEDLLRFMQVKN